jgi:cobalt-zinc-cadmium efflux system membrane fusion protein
LSKSKNKIARRFLTLMALLLLTIMSESCADQTKATPTKTEVTLEPGVFKPDRPELFKLVKVEERSLPVELNSNGSVAPDVNRTIHVSSLSSGRIVDLRVRLGDYVKKGQVLLVISSSDLASAAGDYQKARSDEDVASKALQRAQVLFSHGALSEKDLQLAQGTEDKAKVDLQTAEQKVRQLGGDPLHPGVMVELRAPVAGTIVEQNVAGFEGVKSLDNSPNLFTIADLSQVWVLCDVYENDLGAVRVGDEAEIRLNAYPDKVFRGRVDNISRVLDPNTRSAKVRIVLPNRDGSLRPGMYAVATFRSRKLQPRIVVPGTAVMRLQDKDWVFRKEGAQFRRIEVHALGGTSDGMQQIKSAVQPGDEVVANALEFSAEVAEQGK